MKDKLLVSSRASDRIFVMMMAKNRNYMKGVFLGLICVASLAAGARAAEARWTEEKARDWQAREGWLVGCNFIPSTAINQLEMWQVESFDPVTIDRELGYAEGLGFNTARVFLHNLLWKQDAAGFLRRMEGFLKLAAHHHIQPIFVFFDSCWDPDPKLGRQRDPKPFVHNSGWVQSPGREYLDHPERLDELKDYVVGVLTHFAPDRRIAAWDLFNEPDNGNDSSYDKKEPVHKREAALVLLEKVFVWAREANPSQPVTSGVWKGNWSSAAALSEFERIQLLQSDIITFHNYGKPDEVRQSLAQLRGYHRPILCTEYMARPVGSTFEPILGIFKQEAVGACNWGFVSGKTQTIFPWASWTKAYTGEPPLWFHDIFRKDGTPYKIEEVRYIRSQTLGR